MRPSPARLFQTFRALQHENPLGLPRAGTPPKWPTRPKKRKITGVDKVVAVSSAKGGVGKSTIAANLAAAFARLGYRSGILDVDIFGPSIPTLFNLSGEPRLSSNNQLIPMTNYGVKTMSMGYLVDENAPVVWRGPMVMKAVQQLLHEVDWGGLDILILDLPPGTGDTQLTITQQVILDGSVIVTTPHTLATKDAVKGINMFKTVGVDITGIVRNMFLYKCPHCQGEEHVFGDHKNITRLATEHNIRILGDIPLQPGIGEDGERGKPTVIANPTSVGAKEFMKIARGIRETVGLPKLDEDKALETE